MGEMVNKGIFPPVINPVLFVKDFVVDEENIEIRLIVIAKRKIN